VKSGYVVWRSYVNGSGGDSAAEKKKALCLIPVPTLPAVYCRCYAWTSRIGMSSYSLYATHYRASGRVYSQLESRLGTLMSEQRVCTRDSGPPTDGTVGPTYSEGDEVSNPVGRAEAPNIVGPLLLRHGQSQHSGSATFSTTKELPYSAKSANSGDRKQDKPISPNQAKRFTYA
jgi:hypothetical protein